MKEILEKANELGLMIKGTDIYKRFAELSKQLDGDADARNLLEEYAKLSDAIHDKETQGAVIEVEEKQKFQECAERASQSQLIKEYAATQTYFLNMMMQVQKAISEPKGDPIEQSRIIKPGEPGKIITDF